jgi:phosphoadenosine phosphosulfate reductase
MDLEQSAFEALRFASAQSLKIYKQPLVIKYSGGKDSDVLLHLARKSGIPYEVLHSLTTADAPETVWHVRDTFRRLELANVKCTIDTHRTPDGGNATMWNLIPRKLMPPTRIKRYCCEVLKENGGRGRFIATGVRWDESSRRKNSRGVIEVSHRDKNKRLILMDDNDEARMQFETCQLKGQRTVNPIIGWSTADVWDYVTAEHIPMNPLYGCGHTRVGCIGCPLASKRTRIEEFIIWPKYKQAYIRAFDRMLKERHRRGKMDGGMRWGDNGVDIFNWWMENAVLPGQEVLEEFREDLI